MKLKLSTGLMRNVVTRVISKAVYEKLGYKITVEINEIGLTDSDGKVRLHLNVNADMDNAEFMKLVKTVGFD